MTMRVSILSGAVVLAAAFLAAPPAARAASIEQTAAICGACHGQNGVPVNKSIPVIWGQNEGYLYLELRDYKVGNRKNPTMSGMAVSMDKQTMKDLAAYYAAKPWPNLQQPAASHEMAQHAETIQNSAGCKGCHAANWEGDSVTPRVAGQGVEYLRQTMAQFRGGDRTNNPWMSALLKTYTDEDIESLARYIAGQ